MFSFFSPLSETSFANCLPIMFPLQSEQRYSLKCTMSPFMLIHEKEMKTIGFLKQLLFYLSFLSSILGMVIFIRSENRKSVKEIMTAL